MERDEIERNAKRIEASLDEWDAMAGKERLSARRIQMLHSGDEVTWNDPDDGLCTRTLTIQKIEFKGEVICITDTEGQYLECLASELS